MEWALGGAVAAIVLLTWKGKQILRAIALGWVLFWSAARPH